MTEQNESQNGGNASHSKPPPNGWSIVGAVLAVIVSSAIAFCCTCFPVGVAIAEFGGGLIEYDAVEDVRRINPLIAYAYYVGGVAALLVGYIFFRYFRKSWGKK